MYGRGGVTTIIASSTVTGAGIITLPHTSGNPLGTLLAYSAITVGAIAIISHIVVRVMRRMYS